MKFKHGYCKCSSYDYLNEEGKVHEFQCVRDSGGHPCFYIMLPEKYWYDDKSHKVRFFFYGLWWRLSHPFYRYRHRKCSLEVI